MSLLIRALGQGIIDAAAPTRKDLCTANANKANDVKAIRLVNTGASTITLNIYFVRSAQTKRWISPKNLTLAPNQMYVDEVEVTMEAGDKIQADASSANAVEFVISGVERDQA